MCTRLPYLTSGHWCTVITSPRRTLRFLRTHLFIRILPASHVSSARTMQTVSFRRFLDQHRVAAEELELLHRREVERRHRVVVRSCASSTIRRLGFFFFCGLTSSAGGAAAAASDMIAGCFEASFCVACRTCEGSPRWNRTSKRASAASSRPCSWCATRAVVGRHGPTAVAFAATANARWKRALWAAVRRRARLPSGFGSAFQIADHFPTPTPRTPSATANHSERDSVDEAQRQVLQRQDPQPRV